METLWFEVEVEGPQGIRGVHYVEVSASFAYPWLVAAKAEREKGYKVLGVRPWSKERR